MNGMMTGARLNGTKVGNTPMIIPQTAVREKSRSKDINFSTWDQTVVS